MKSANVGRAFEFTKNRKKKRVHAICSKRAFRNSVLLADFNDIVRGNDAITR